ncbi:HYR domain-containing protein, partial [Algibacter miyuki]
MKKNYNKQSSVKTTSFKMMLFLVLLFSTIHSNYGQNIDFTNRESSYTIQGDFTMIGNTNLTLVNYADNKNNNADMEYIDVDTDDNTINSSSSILEFSTENQADPECSNIIFAGLYWTGRAAPDGIDANDDNDFNSNTFSVDLGNGETKILDKTKVLIKGPDAADYVSVQATDIKFPNGTNNNMYAAFADVTNIITDHGGSGEYFVADIATVEGNGGNIGYSGGWGLVVVYENSKMKWRSVSVFDGYAHMASGVAEQFIDVTGFKAVEDGAVNIKLGVMAGEGDVSVSGDRFAIVEPNGNDVAGIPSTLLDNTYLNLSHTGNSQDNFFNSSVLTHNGATGKRNPELTNNTGVDIAMFNIPNTGNTIIANKQNYTRFKYNSTQDAYLVFNVTFAVDAYIPEIEGVLTVTSLNNGTPSDVNTSLAPSQSANYEVEIKNTGTEATDNTTLVIPLPETIDIDELTVLTTTDPSVTGGTPYVIDKVNRELVWNIGTLPAPIDSSDVLATISFELTVTTDCNVLRDEDLNENVSVNGRISGVGAVSGADFSRVLIQGYDSDDCVGQPIPAPINIPIVYEDYVNSPPTGTAPGTVNILCNADIPAVDLTSVTNLADNSGITPVVTHDGDVSDGGSPIETITRTYNITDDCGNVTQVTQEIIIEDTVPPTITCPADITGNASSGTCDSVVTITEPTATDNCITTVTFTGTRDDGLALTDAYPVGTTTITWIANDGTNDSDSCEQKVIITDTEVPVITCPTDIALDADVDACENTNVTIIEPTATDNCATTFTYTGTRSDNLALNAAYPVGVTTITWIANDGTNDSAPCEQTVTITDAQAPVITCPANIALDADVDACESTNVTITEPTATDNCATSFTYTGTRSDNLALNAPYPVGVTTITWIANDGTNDSDPCEQTVTITDAQAPVITCPADIALDADVDACENTNVTIIEPSATDNCATSFTYTGTRSDNLALNAPYPVGVTTITWIANDGTNDSDPCEQTVTITDAQAPIITCPADIALDADVDACENTNVTITEPTATDNCATTFTYTGTRSDNLALNAPYPVGVTTITWIANDGTNDSAPCEQTVTITDAQAPVITCPADIERPADEDLCSAVITDIGTPVTSDNCGIQSVENDAPPRYILGENIVTWTVIDTAGNQTQCEQTITITDGNKPEIECPEDITVPVNSDSCVATNVYLGSISVGDCTDVDITNDSPDSFPIGTTVVTWTVTDEANNITNCTQNVTVTDQTNPIALCKAFTAELGADGTVSITVDNIDNGSTDNCNIASITLDKTNFSCDDLGDNTVALTVTDDAGNNAICTATVTVVDLIAPVITCPADIALDADVDACENTNVTITEPTATDNCATTFTYTGTRSDNLALNAPYPVGVTTITWIANDGTNDSAPCEQTVTITDAQAPIITCPSDIALDADVDACENTNVTITEPTATDNCATTFTYTGTRSDNLALNAAYPVGVTTITWVANDGTNDSAPCEQTITITDAQAPVITCPADIALDADVDACENTNVTITEPTATDNCATTFTYTGTRSDNLALNAPYPVGVTTITWIANDGMNDSDPCEQTVTITDAQAPVITCPADIALDADVDACENT